MFRLRLTLSEKSHLETLAKDAGFNVSDYMRMVVLSNEPKSRVATPQQETLLKLIAELNKMGSNLNQIARVINTNHKNGVPILSDTATIELQHLSYALDALLRLVHHKIEQDGH
jgi:hypothetical protein